MARTSENPKITNRTQRARLAPLKNGEAYWHLIAEGQHVGYCKSTDGNGTWRARYYKRDPGAKTGKRVFKALAAADDTTPADGLHVLDFPQAIEKANQWIEEQKTASGERIAPGKYTVADAMEHYLRNSELKKRKKLTRTRSVVKVHILPKLGPIKLDDLTPKLIEDWRDKLAEAAPQVRRSSAAPDLPAHRTVDLTNPEIARKRAATANRIFTVLRAALNYAKKKTKTISSNEAWADIEPFEQVDAVKVRYLSLDECLNLIAACPSDFQQLVRAALYTGCRYGELIGMRADAFNPDANTIHIPRSKSGKQRYIPITDEGAAFFHGVTRSKHKEDSMFVHTEGPCKGEAWEETQQRYWMESACERARITPAIGFHILRHTYASQLAMNGTPMPVIASLLGHADTRMTEKHYAHLSPSHVANTLRANLPNFGFEVAAPGPVLVKKAS